MTCDVKPGGQGKIKHCAQPRVSAQAHRDARCLACGQTCLAGQLTHQTFPFSLNNH
jgi:hypothetical protein